MLHGTRFISVVGGVLITAVAMAQATPPAGAPAGATGLCKDGTYWTGATKRGACHGHKGVQDWYATTDTAGGAAAASASASDEPAPSVAMKASPAPAASAPAASVPAAAPSAKTAGAPASTVAQAPGGGPGLVWVNTQTNVYHCSTDKWYGKTKSGQYMSEADAIAKGNHADHGKACSK